MKQPSRKLGKLALRASVAISLSAWAGLAFATGDPTGMAADPNLVAIPAEAGGLPW